MNRDFRNLEKIAKINTRGKKTTKIKQAKFITILYKKRTHEFEML